MMTGFIHTTSIKVGQDAITCKHRNDPVRSYMTFPNDNLFFICCFHFLLQGYIVPLPHQK